MARRRRRRGEPRRHRRRSLVEALEPRILLSADLPGLAVDAALPADADAPASEERVLPRHPDATGVEQHAGSRELVFVDAGVEGYQELLRDLREGAGSGRHIEVVLLDSAQDGIAQIGAALSAYDHDLDAVHVVSHGSEQGVLLGDTWLTAESLAARAGDVAAWRDALSADADLLLYGCNLAAGGEGQSLVEELSLLTGADVAASADLTGAAARGGDWDLEYATGSLETSVTFSGTFQQVWSGVLGNATFQQGADGYASTSDTTLDSQEAGFSHGGWSEVEVDGNGVNQGLIRFDNLFGSGPGQIPVGSTIHSASLAVDVTNSASDTTTISLHRMLMPWNESATWFSTGNGVQANDVEALSTPDSVLSGAPETDENGWQTFTGLETTLQGWADGTANEGWVVLNDGANGWRFASSEDSDATRRPVLSVSFTPPGAHSVVDNFDASTYGANDGTDPWSSDWQEVGESGSPGSGGMRVVDEEGGSLRFGGAATRDGDYVWRQADLSGATSATLNFQYKWEDGKSGAVVLGVEVRASDQDPWTHLATMGPAPYVYQNFSQDISGFASSTTQVRFVIESREDDKLYVDNVQIEFTTPSGAGSAIWSEALSNTPETNTFDGSGFGTETGTADVGNQWQVVAGAESPTRDEKIVIGVNDGGGPGPGTGNLTGQMWKDGSWTAFTFNDFATDIHDERWGFDVAYESQSGRAMVVYATGAQHELSYRIWDGASWSGPDTIWIPSGFDTQQVRLAASPDSNEMVLVTSNEASKDMARVWNGTSWGNGVTLNDGGSISNTDVYVAYEQQSGHAMVVYGGNSEDVYYRTWNGSSWSGVGAIAAPSGATGVVRWTVLASDPNSDRLAIGVIGENKEAWLATWDGAVWENSVLATIDSPHKDRLAVAVGFEGISGNALAAYATRADQVAYRTWTEGAGWSLQKTGPDLAHHPDSMTLDSDPHSDTVMMSVVDQGKDITFAAWDGGSWSVESEQEIDAGTNKGQPFLYLWDYSAPPNTDPTADAGGANAIDEGQSVVLDASASNDPDGDTLTYAWDLDGDSVYGDVTGKTLTVGWTELSQTFGIDDGDPGGTSYAIGLRVSDGRGGVDTDSLTLTVENTAPTLTVTGDTSVTAGSVYTLNLSASDPGADAITSWTIDWGDGVVDTIAGNPSSVTHTYTNVGFTNNILVSATDGDGTYIAGDLLTTSFETDSLMRFDATTGEFLQEFGKNDVDRPVDIQVGPDGGIYVTGFGTDDIYRYEADGSSGAVFVSAGSGGLSAPSRLAFGPDGNLYVTSMASNEVLRFSGVDGTAMGAFVASGLDEPDGITFGPDGDLYVANRGTGQILRFDGLTGVRDLSFTANGPTGYMDILFGPDGHLWVTNQSSDDIRRYDGATGSDLGIFSSTGATDFAGIAFGPDGRVYMSDAMTSFDKIIRYPIGDGNDPKDFITKGAEGLDRPVNIVFTPAHQVHVLNNPPTGADATISTPEDTPYSFQLSDFGFSDPVDGDAFQAVIITTAPGAGTLRNGATVLTGSETVTAAAIANGDLIFTPAPDANGTAYASFTFQVKDDGFMPGRDTDPTPNTITIDVTPVNDTPTAAGESYTTAEDTPLTVTGPGVLGNDGDVDGDALSAVLDGGPSNGTLSLAADGSFTYTPDADFHGADSFTYHAEDPSGASSGIVTVDIDVTPVNDAPTAADDTYSTAEDTPLTVTGPGVLGNDGDVDGDTLSAVLDGGPSNGTLSLAADGSFTYTPDADFHGADSFTYHAEDPSGASSGIVTVDIDVTPVNDAPTAADDAYSTAEDTPLTVTGPGVLGNDGDVDGDTLSAVLDSSPSNGTLSLAADGSFTYTPDVDFHGADSFTYHAEDPSGVSSGIVTVDIDVTPVNDAPTAADDTYSTAEDTPLTVSGPGVLGNDGDVDGDTLSAVLDGGPSNGTLSLATDGSFTYTPDADFTGADSFTYRAEDPSGVSSGIVTVDIDVTPVNDAPTAADDSYSTAEDTPLTVTGPGVLGNDGDVDGDTLSALLDGGPSNGTLSLATDGSFTYTSDADFHGADSFTYHAEDPSGASSGIVTVDIDVTPVNDAPTAADDTYSTAEDTPLTVTGPGVLGNDGDVDGDTLSALLAGGPSNGTLSLAADGSFTYTPDADFHGADSFTYHAEDPSGASSGIVTVDIDVTPVNDAPTAADDSYSTAEDTPLTVTGPGVLGNDGDVDGDALSAMLDSGPSNGTLSLAADGSFTYTPDADFHGADSFTYHAEDPSGASSGIVTVDIDVTPVNDAPTAADDSYSTAEDTPLTVTGPGVLGNDGDVDGDALSAVLDAGPSNGTLALGADGSFTYTPDADFHGADSFTYHAEDPSGASSGIVTVDIDVTPVNDAPTAADDAYSTAEDTPLTVTGPGVLGNDGDVDGDTLSVVLAGGPSNGTLSLGADGSFTYTPDADFHGTDSFTYHAEDPSGASSSTVTVDIDVTPVNDAPTAADDSYSTAEDTPLTVTGPGVLGNDGDVDGDALSAVLDGGPSNGTLSLGADGSFTYTPDADFHGTDSFTYHAEDPSGATSGTVTVDIDVTPVNDAPTATADSYSTAEDTPLTVAGPGVLGNDGDVDGDALSAVLGTGPSNGTLGLNADGSFTYAPDADFHGTDSFTYHAEDPSGATSGTVTVDIDVTPVNDAPTAADDTYSTAEDTPLTVSGPGVLGNDGDVDGDALSAVLGTGPSNGTLGLNADGSFSYTPDADFTGTDSFTYHAEDPGGAPSGTVAVTISVTPVNDAPTATAESYSTAEDTPLTVAGPGVLGNDGDVDGDALSAVLGTGPSNGTLGLNSDGSFTYTPEADFHGTDSFTYHAEDPSGATSGTVTVSIDVTPVNDAPTATADSYSTAEDTPLTVAGPGVLGNDGDVDADALSAVLGTGPSNGTLALGADGSFTYTPDADFTGTDSFTYHAEDPSGAASGTVTVSIDVTPVNDAPTATADSYSTAEDTPLTVAGPGVLGNDGDVDGDALSAVLGTGPSNGTLTLGADGSFTYTPDADFTGTDSFTYHAEDPSGAASGTVTVSIDVTPANDAPTATGESYSTPEDTPLTVSGPGVLGNDGDVDGDTLSAVLGTGPSNGTLGLNADGSFTYTPGADFHGTDSFTYHAEDPSGAASGTVTVSIDVTPVNDAPVLTPGSPSLSPITEDQTGNLGEQVSAIVGTSVSDADAGALEGIAVTKLSSGQGTWEFSIDGGGTWQAIGSVGNSHALLLSDADRIRFVPDAENADTASFDFRAWDRTSGVVATKVNASATGGTHAFSAAGDRATIQVGAVNDAPGLADALLPEVQADETDPAGKSVAGLFAGGFSDIDAGSALAGVAVVGNGASPAGEGAWSYSSDGGASWSPIGGVSDGSGALALSASTRVRFVPAGGFEGTPTSLSVRGLDDSYAGGFSTTDGGAEIRVQVDTSSHGGISAIAGGTSRLATSVAPAAPPSDPDPEPDPSLGEGPTEEPEPEVDDGLTPDVTETPGDEEESDPGGEGGGSPEPETPGPEAASAEPASPTPGPFFAGELDRSGAEGGSSFARPAIFGESLTEARPQLELSDPAEPDVAPVVEQQAQVWEPETEARALPELQDLLDGVLGFLDSEAGFLDELDHLRESVDAQALLQQAVVGTSTAVAAGLSIGYVVWLTRGGLLLASLVSSIPVWRLVDPIPVLASLGFDDQEPGDDGDSLDSLIRQGAARPDPEGERPGHEAPEVEGDSGARDLDPRGDAAD